MREYDVQSKTNPALIYKVTIRENEDGTLKTRCTCPDYKNRRAKLGTNCKHIVSVL